MLQVKIVSYGVDRVATKSSYNKVREYPSRHDHIPCNAIVFRPIFCSLTKRHLLWTPWQELVAALKTVHGHKWDAESK